MNRIYLCLAHMSEEGVEQKYVKEAFDTNWVVPLGPNVNGFEADLKAYMTGGQAVEREVVALSSGTAAVHLALIACGVGPGDEVIVQSMTFCASSNPIAYLGATPVFVDSEPGSWNMDPALVEQAVRDRQRVTGRTPKAIVAVALYGMPYDVKALMAVADRYGIPLIEDAAEGLGSRVDGRLLGTWGTWGVLSFNGNKMITTSGGGALVCPTAEARNRVMWLATQAREAYPYYEHEAIGYNYRMSNVCAGIGRGQMTVLQAHIEHHRRVAAMYGEAFSRVEGIDYHWEGPGQESNYWLSTILIDEGLRVKGEEQAYTAAVSGAVGGAAGVVHGGGSLHTACEPNRNVEAMRMALDAAGIESRPLWKPMHLQPVYRRGGVATEAVEGCVRQTSAVSVAYVNGVSEGLFRRGLCLPSGPMVGDDDVRRIVDTVRRQLL